MATLTHRTQILLDDQRYRRLKRRAADADKSLGELIREGIDRILDDEVATVEKSKRMQAVEELLAFAPGAVGSPEEIKAVLLDAHTPPIPE